MPQELVSQPDEAKKHVRVFGPDNRYYQFPQGTTKDQAVSFFKKKGITSPESKPPTPAAKPPEAKPETPKPTQTPQDIAAQQLQSQIARWRPRWDTPEQILKDPDWYGRSLRYAGGELIGGGKAIASVAVGGAKLIHDVASALDPIEGYSRPLGEPQLQVGKDVVDMGKGIIDIGKATWDLVRHFPESAADPEKLGNTVTNVAMIVDGGVKLAKSLEGKFPKAQPGQAVTAANKASTGPPSRFFRLKAFEDAYRHSKGMDVAKKISKAAASIHEEIKTHAEGIAKEIDPKIPSGTVSAADEAAVILKAFQDEVKTPEKAHPLLVQMVRDAQATAPKMWTWEKARQFRSSVGRLLYSDKVAGPQKVVLTKVYRDLTNKLGGAAKQYGLEKSWNHYNELSAKVDKEFGDLIDSVRDAQSGKEVAQKLGKDVALSTELSKNLSKYGLNVKEVLDFMNTSKRIARNENGYQRSLFRFVYGSAIGFPTAMGLKMAGAPYIASMGAGFLVGASSTHLINLVRALRLSPDVIEHMMKERELPGRLRFDKGTFPPSGGKALPESTGGSSAAPTPSPKAKPQLKGGISEQGVAASTKPRTRESDIQSHTSEIERLKKVIDNPKATDEEKASARSQIKNHEEMRRKISPEAEKQAKAPKERWYTDKGSIPGEPRQFLDVPGDDLDKAKAAIIEHESPKGTKFEAVDHTGKTLGTFDTQAEARKAAETKFPDVEAKVIKPKKVEEGEHGTGKLAEQAKARERVSKARAKAKRTRESEAVDANARAQATHMDVSQLQIPEMEEFVRTKNSTAFSGLQKLRKSKGITDEMYSEALRYYILEHLEE